MSHYEILKQQVFTRDNYKIVPIRDQDKLDIMKWRNEQMYHLRQNKPLTCEDQDHYFSTVISKLFEQTQPGQVLFSYLENDVCIGYGGLVHINWIDRHAEISFIINTELESRFFEKHWTIYLRLIEQVAFEELKLHKIFTYAFDLRPHLYPILEKCGFKEEARLKDHCYFEGNYKDVLIHSKIDAQITFRKATPADEESTYKWATDPLIRKYSFSKNEITREEHGAWFHRKINDINSCYYLAMMGNETIGSIRFDKKDDGAMISYLLDAAYHGKGLGKKLLSQGTRYFLENNQVKSVYGLVIKKNSPSMKAFRYLGYEETDLDADTVKFIKIIHANR